MEKLRRLRYYLPYLSRFDDGSGWFRLWGSNGPGIAWKSISAPQLFSERNGYVKYYGLGRIRWTWLKRG